MATNMKENGFETMIVKYLVENNHYEEGSNSDYNKIYAIDEVRLFRFLHDTQYEKLAELRIEDNEIEKKKFLDRLSKKISDDGVINIIRKGMKYKNKTVDFYMVRPSEGNQEAKESYDKNIFSVTRQLRYSNDYGRLALDVCIFLNGLPIITMELKNQITKQNHDDAIRQYMTDRTPDELLFQFKRCIVHFAVDDDEIYMCTELKKEKSFFMPFNKGNNNGAGNPRNPNGLKTDYLWKDILTKPCLSNILENYVQITEEKDEDTGRKSYKQIFPRYHQLSVVTSLLADAKNDGPGHRYLIQHSAGSGKSNSIAWLAHQLVTLKKDKKDVFDTVIVVTDRVNLDKQIRDTIKQFMQVSSTVGWAKDASTLSTLMEQGKKIIITIVHKFQFILDAVSADYKNKKFAIIIDEAHSSQNGSLAAKMNIAVSGNVYDDDDEFEDKLNTIIDDIKFGMSKRPKFYIENTLSLNGKMEIQFNKNRISISLYVLNIGRGEANNIKISSLILDSKGSTWDTELRTYKEIATSSGICLMFYKELSEREWKEYSNKMLEEPFKMCIDIEYDDLVGFHHKLNSLLMVKRFVHIRDEDNNVIENVLVINPYDSTIQNMTSIDS